MPDGWKCVLFTGVRPPEHPTKHYLSISWAGYENTNHPISYQNHAKPPDLGV